MIALHPCQARHLPNAECFRKRIPLAIMPDVEPDIDGEPEENAALGILAENKIALEDAGLTETDFTGPRRTVFKALSRLAQDGRPLDLTALAGQLKEDGELDRIGGPPFLSGLIDAAEPAAHYAYHRDRLLTVSRKRRYASAGDRLAALARKQGITPASLQLCAADVLRALESQEAETAPGAVPLCDLVTPAPDAADELLRTRFLCRGGAAFLIAQSGKGKSSLCRQFALSWGAGLSCFGITPARPLRQLLIQAENDQGDEAAFRDGIRASGMIPPAALHDAERRVFIVQLQDAAGDSFLARLGVLLSKHRPDIVWLDPLLSFLGGDANRQDIVSAFLRNGIQPLLTRHGCGCLIAHHTPKPMRATDKGGPADMGGYLGAGSAELTNWPRAVLTLECTAAGGVYKLRVPKRSKQLGWVDQDGEPTDARLIAHSGDGRIYWRDATPEESTVATAGTGRKAVACPADAARVLGKEPNGMTYTGLFEAIMADRDCAERTATGAISKARKAGLIECDGGIYRVTGVQGAKTAKGAKSN